MTRQSDTHHPFETPPPAASGSGRMAGGERRRQIVEIAMRVFSERGFRGTTTKEIAQAAGVSEAIIFRHFATKDELYSAIIDHKACVGSFTVPGGPAVEAIQCSVAAAVNNKDDRAVFEGVALEMMRHHEQDPQFLRLLLYSALEGHQLAQMFWDRNVRVMYEFLGNYVRQRQRDGAFRGLDPRVAVRAFTSVVIHHSLNNILWDKDKTRRILDIPNEDAARAFTDILLNGIATERESPRTISRPNRSSSNKGGDGRSNQRQTKKAPAKKKRSDRD